MPETRETVSIFRLSILDSDNTQGQLRSYEKDPIWANLLKKVAIRIIHTDLWPYHQPHISPWNKKHTTEQGNHLPIVKTCEKKFLSPWLGPYKMVDKLLLEAYQNSRMKILYILSKVVKCTQISSCDIAKTLFFFLPFISFHFLSFPTIPIDSPTCSQLVFVEIFCCCL